MHTFTVFLFVDTEPLLASWWYYLCNLTFNGTSWRVPIISKSFLPWRECKLRKELQRFERRMEYVNLIPKENVFSGKYSGGMKHRLSISLCFTEDPKIVRLEEWTYGTDPLVRRVFLGDQSEIEEGSVILMITSYIAEAQHMAGHNIIGIIAQGILRMLGN